MGTQVIGKEREKMGRDLAKSYNNGATLRELAATTGRSYGFIHRILNEHGVQLRKRGGPRPGAGKRKSKA